MIMLIVLLHATNHTDTKHNTNTGSNTYDNEHNANR